MCLRALGRSPQARSKSPNVTTTTRVMASISIPRSREHLPNEVFHAEEFDLQGPMWRRIVRHNHKTPRALSCFDTCDFSLGFEVHNGDVI